MCSRPITVLLLSEDRRLVRCLGKLLKIWACEVCQVGSYRQAPHALQSVLPDFLILDAQPSLHDALEISRLESARRARGEVYTLLLTESAEVHELCQALEAGVDDFLTKPVVHCELLSRLRVGMRELEFERRLGEQARLDPLTGLPNRRALERRLQQLSPAASGMSPGGVCVLMEIDYFAWACQQFGQEAGETVLRCAAATLRDLIGEGAFLASLGGGQFALLPDEMAAEEATEWIDRLRQAWAAAEIPVGERKLQFTASFGVADIESGGSMAAEEVLRRCAEALDLAKASGGDVVLRHGDFDDQDDAGASFAAPGKLFEGAVARDVMTPLPGVLRAGEPAAEALALLRRGRLAALPVVDDDGKLLGIVIEDCSAADRSGRAAANLTVGQVMNEKVTCLDESATFAELVENFAREAATPIVITDTDQPTGLVMPENLVLLGQKLIRENLFATVPFSPASDYLVVPDASAVETAQ